MSEKIDKAAHAHTNLNIFNAIGALLESGVIYGRGTAQTTSQRIIKLCNQECQRQLRIYDRERSKQ